MPRQLLGTAIASNTITTTQLQTTVVNQISAGGGPRVSSLIYPGDDTAANTVGGQTVYVTGSGFAANANVYINGNAVPSISFISASNLAITTPALSAATYPVYVINPETGATAIHIPGLRVSGDPTWVTAAGSLSASQDEASAWSYTVSANSDSAVTYALAGGSSLPTGISLAANGLISGTLSSPPGTETTYNFTVVATDAENQNASRAFSVSVSSGEGVLFANNVLLIHADGTNNKNNHTFLDSSNNNFTITRYGNPTQGSFSPFSQTGWSNYCDGSGDYFTIANSTELDQVGDYCHEGWFFPIKGQTLMPFGFKDVNSFVYLGIYNDKWSVNQHYVGEIIQGPTVSYNTWVHVALTRQGSTVRLFINGVLRGTATNSNNISGTATYWFGRSPDGNWNYYGYVSNWRVTKGSVPTSYQTSSTTIGATIFTPPSSILSRTSQGASNTVLLLCQSNRFVDNSVNNFTLSREGDVSVQAFSPFAPTAAYSTANVGGSAYFDTSADYLTVPATTEFAFGTGAFTMEFWIYPFAYGSSIVGGQIFGTTNAAQTGYSINIGEGVSRFRFISNASGTWADNLVVGTNEGPTLNTWSHMAISRNGANLSLWKNGVRVATNSSASSYNYSGTTGVIGRFNDGTTTRDLNAIVSGLRVIKGTALYDPTSSTISVPTSPPTNVANTQLLCNFTNAGIFDQTAKNIIETLGDAKVSTTQYKYGTASMYFDGTGDYLTIPNSQNFNFGSGNFTVECWVYCTNTTPTQSIFAMPANGSGFSGLLFEISSGNTRIVSSWTGGWDILNANTGSISVNTWTHFAIVRNGGTLTVYKDGTSTYTNTGLGTSSLVFGTDPATISYGRINQSDQRYFYGYIDDFRVTKGYARYTSNFTAPTSAFKDK